MRVPACRDHWRCGDMPDGFSRRSLDLRLANEANCRLKWLTSWTDYQLNLVTASFLPWMETYMSSPLSPVGSCNAGSLNKS